MFHLKQIYLTWRTFFPHFTTPSDKPLSCWCLLHISWFFKACTALSMQTPLYFTVQGYLGHIATRAQPRNPGAWAAIAPHTQCEALVSSSRLACMLINPCCCSETRWIYEEDEHWLQKPSYTAQKIFLHTRETKPDPRELETASQTADSRQRGSSQLTGYI